MSVFELTEAEVMTKAAERRLATANHALDELRVAFQTTFEVTTTRPAATRPTATTQPMATTPEPLPAHLHRYAEEVDRWRLEALAIRATRPYEGR
jgi:hypothetical protein